MPQHAGKYAEEHDPESRYPAIFHGPLSQDHNSRRSFFSERGDTANKSRKAKQASKATVKGQPCVNSSTSAIFIISTLFY